MASTTTAAIRSGSRSVRPPVVKAASTIMVPITVNTAPMMATMRGRRCRSGNPRTVLGLPRPTVRHTIPPTTTATSSTRPNLMMNADTPRRYQVRPPAGRASTVEA